MVHHLKAGALTLSIVVLCTLGVSAAHADGGHETDVDENALASVLERDLGMTPQEFNAAGARFAAAAPAVRRLQATEGVDHVAWEGGHFVVSGSGDAARAAAASQGMGFRERHGGGEISGLAELVSLYTSMVGTDGLMFIGSGADGYVIKVREPDVDPDGADPTPTPSASNSPEASATPVPTPEPSQASALEPSPSASQSSPAPSDDGSGGPTADTEAEASPSPSDAGMEGATGGDKPRPTPSADTARAASGPKISPAAFARVFGVKVEKARGPAEASAIRVDAGQGWGTSSGLVCSLGFPGYTATGAKMYVTAGHCADGQGSAAVYPRDPANEPAVGSSGGNYPLAMGNLSWHVFGGTSNESGTYGTDLATMTVSSGTGYLTPPTAWRWGKATQLAITGMAEPVVGMPVCRSGRTTGWHCGRLGYIGWTYVNNGGGDMRYVWSMMAENLVADRGDSGGPWLTGNKAVGIMSAIGTNASGTPISTAALVSDLTAFRPGAQLSYWLGSIYPTGAVQDATREYHAAWAPGATVSGWSHVAAGDTVTPGAYVQVTVDGVEKARAGLSSDGKWSFVMPTLAPGQNSVVLRGALGRSRGAPTTVDVRYYSLIANVAKANLLVSEPFELRSLAPSALAGATAVLEVEAYGKVYQRGTQTVPQDGHFTFTSSATTGHTGTFRVRSRITNDGLTWVTPWKAVVRDSGVSLSSPNPRAALDYGQVLRVTGAVTPARATDVDIQFNIPGRGHQTVATTATSSTGAFSVPVFHDRHVVQDYQFRVVAKDDPMVPATDSFTRVEPVVTVDQWPSLQLTAGQYTDLRGKAPIGVKLRYQGFEASTGTYHSLGERYPNYTGQYGFRSMFSMGEEGRYAVRAYSDTPSGRVFSPWVWYDRVRKPIALTQAPSSTVARFDPVVFRGTVPKTGYAPVHVEVFIASRGTYTRRTTQTAWNGSFSAASETGVGVSGRYAARVVAELPNGDKLYTAWRWFSRP